VRIALALLIACAAGCHGPLTELVVSTDTDHELDAVRWEIDATAIGGGVSTRQAAFAGGPLRMTVVHERGPYGPIRLRAYGLRGDAEVARAEVEVSFVPGASVLVPLDLYRACDGQRCGPGETCDARGRCVAVAAPDAGLNADGGAGCYETCAGSECQCDRGCRCDLTCGEDCEKVRCDHDGTSCTLDARGASNAELDCRSGARCVVDARGASNLDRVRCHDGASCEVDCRDTSNCRVTCDEGAECLVRCDGDDCALGGEGCEERRDCGGGVFACNRGCP